MTADADPRLAEIGLRRGDRVRFRRRDSERWKEAVVDRREKDGGIGLRDTKGATRSMALDRIEVRGTGPRGGISWEPLPEVAARAEQLKLL